MRTSDFNELRAFAAVLSQGNFTRAGVHLGITASAVSQLISALEERLGKRLLNRTTRSVAVSEAGQALAERVLPLLDDLETATTADLALPAPGRLRLSAVAAAVQVLERRIPAFLLEHPEVWVEIKTSERGSASPGIGYDGEIRISDAPVEHMRTVPIGGAQRMACVAAPGYLKDHPAPDTPHDLALHNCLVALDPLTGTALPWDFMRITASGVESHRIDAAGQLHTTSAALLLAATKVGAGVSYLPESVVADPLASGALVRLLEDWTPERSRFSLQYSSRRAPSAALRAFIEFLRRS